MKELKRTRVDKFKIEDATELADIQEDASNAEKNLITIEKYFEDKEKIILNDRKLELFLNGVLLTFEMPNDIYKIYNNEKFIGIGTVNNNLLKRDIVL